MPARPPKVALMTTPDETEAQFYEALQLGDLDRVMAVWADDDDIACIHPSGPRLLGLHAIRAGYESLLEGGGLNLRIAQVRRLVVGNSAVHHVLEELRVETPEGTQSAWVLATHVFLKTPQGWRLLVHHASPGSAGAAQEVGDEPSMLH